MMWSNNLKDIPQSPFEVLLNNLLRKEDLNKPELTFRKAKSLVLWNVSSVFFSKSTFLNKLDIPQMFLCQYIYIYLII